MDRRNSNVVAGTIAGLSGGVVFGVMMHAMEMMGMVAMLAESESLAVGWVVHLAISAVFGVVYAIVLGPMATSNGPAALWGVGFGLVAWVAGALVVMPLWLGMSEMVFVVGQDQVMSLLGHVMFGVVLGLVYTNVAAKQPSTKRVA